MTTPIASVAETASLTAARRLPHIAPNQSMQRLQRAAQDFESVFLSQMVQPMFTSEGPAEPFGGGFAEDMWRALLADEIGKSVAEAGGIGIADAVIREVIQLQQGAPAAIPSSEMETTP